MPLGRGKRKCMNPHINTFTASIPWDVANVNGWLDPHIM